MAGLEEDEKAAVPEGAVPVAPRHPVPDEGEPTEHILRKVADTLPKLFSCHVL